MSLQAVFQPTQQQLEVASQIDTRLAEFTEEANWWITYMNQNNEAVNDYLSNIPVLQIPNILAFFSTTGKNWFFNKSAPETVQNLYHRLKLRAALTFMSNSPADIMQVRKLMVALFLSIEPTTPNPAYALIALQLMQVRSGKQLPRNQILYRANQQLNKLEEEFLNLIKFMQVSIKCYHKPGIVQYHTEIAPATRPSIQIRRSPAWPDAELPILNVHDIYTLSIGLDQIPEVLRLNYGIGSVYQDDQMEREFYHRIAVDAVYEEPSEINRRELRQARQMHRQIGDMTRIAQLLDAFSPEDLTAGSDMQSMTNDTGANTEITTGPPTEVSLDFRSERSGENSGEDSGDTDGESFEESDVEIVVDEW